MKALISSLAALAMVLSCSAAPSTSEGLFGHLPTNAPVKWKGPTNGFGIPDRKAELHWWSPVKERVVTFYAEPHGKAPELMAVLIDSEPAQVELRKRQEEWQAEYHTNRGFMPNKLFPIAQGGDLPDFSKAKWIPFKTNLTVDLGPGDGHRWLWVGFKNRDDANPGWDNYPIVVQGSPPVICINNPKQLTTAQPMIQLQGYCSSALAGPIRYERFNQAGVLAGQGEGLVNDQHLDMSLWIFTTNYFTCYDIPLDPGTNTFVLHARDLAGYSVTANCVVVFTTLGKTNPPAFKLDWPQDGTLIRGSQFDIKGPSDDPTAAVTALVCDDQGHTAQHQGFAERNGYLWIERVPLAPGISYLTVVVTDVAQNSTVTNISVGKSADILYMDKLADPQQLWQRRITVTGYYSRTNHSVSVNGVKAHMKPDGHWVAENVPVKVAEPEGPGAVGFNMTTDDDDTQLTPAHVWQPAFLGGPTNSLRAALSLTAVSTNEYNHYRMCLGITNVSGTNQLRKWMLPSVEGRFALRLLDNERKAVPLIESSQKSGKALADNLNIHHLGKMELACIDGIVPLTTNMAVQLADVNLDQHVRMPPPGDYRLEVQERLFQIAEDGRLIPISLPPVIANVKVLDQPSEMTFYLKQLVQQGKLFWGPALNSLRIGVTYDLNRPRGGNAVLVEVFLENLSTNDVRNLRLPRLEEQFDISLSDATGTEVPKTALGNQRGLPLTTQSATSGGASDFSRALGTLFGVGSPRRSSGFRPVFLSARDATSIGSFNLNEFFDVKSPGKYRLTYQQRLYQFGATNKLTGLTMPMVVVPIEIP